MPEAPGLGPWGWDCETRGVRGEGGAAPSRPQVPRSGALTHRVPKVRRAVTHPPLLAAAVRTASL